MYHWLVFFHVLSAFTFMMAHGVSANVAFKLRGETNRERIAALLDVSLAYQGFMYFSLLIMLLTGIWLGFLGEWWGYGWIWVSLALFVLEFLAMWAMGTIPFGRVRRAAGLPYFEGGKMREARPPADPEEIAAQAAAIKPLPIALVGYGGLVVILWLMVLKPF